MPIASSAAVASVASESDRRPRIPELDGLRGLAIGLVLIYHFFLVPSSPTPRTFFAYLMIPGRLAWSGVDLFFVLSGFLIGGILLDARSSPNYFRAFYARRFFRIIPMYTVALVFFYGVQLAVRFGHANYLSGMLEDQLPWYSYPPFIQNFWMVLRNTLGPLTLGVTWSLAIEEQFYLTLPVLVRLLERRTLIAMVVAGICLAPICRFGVHLLGFNYRQGIAVLMPCRADSLLLGVAGALIMRNPALVQRLRSYKGALLVLIALFSVGFVWLTLYSPYSVQLPMLTFGYTLIAFLYASILLYAVNFPDTLIGKFFKLRWLRSLGLIAYGAYLLHFPVLGIAFGLFFGRLPFINSVGTAALSAVALAVTIAICALSWKFFETPLIRIGHRVSYSDRHKDSQPVGVAGAPAGAGS